MTNAHCEATGAIPVPDKEGTMNEDVVHFGKLHEDGQITDERDIKKSDIMQCPHLIIMPEHYRDDGSCRCDDPEHTEMSDWGYTWDAEQERWIGEDYGRLAKNHISRGNAAIRAPERAGGNAKQLSKVDFVVEKEMTDKEAEELYKLLEASGARYDEEWTCLYGGKSELYPKLRAWALTGIRLMSPTPERIALITKFFESC